jgi:uncharacterized protein YkwD
MVVRGKKTKPRFLIWGVVLFFVLMGFGFWVFLRVNKENLKLNQQAAVLPIVIAELTNKSRVDAKIRPLQYNPILAKAAELKAQDMAKKQYFSHVGPDGVPFWIWLLKAGYKGDVAGENLAIDFFESKDVENGWMNSPTHKENILRSDFTEVGVGTAIGKFEGRDTIYVVQFFGSPTSN